MLLPLCALALGTAAQVVEVEGLWAAKMHEAPVEIVAQGPLPLPLFEEPGTPGCEVRRIEDRRPSALVRAMPSMLSVTITDQPYRRLLGVSVDGRRVYGDGTEIRWFVSPDPRNPLPLTFSPPGVARIAAVHRRPPPVDRPELLAYLLPDCASPSATSRGAAYVNRLTQTLGARHYGLQVECPPEGPPVRTLAGSRAVRSAVVRVLDSFKFALVVESSQYCSYHVADQLAMVMEAGAVPVYVGDDLCLSAFVPNPTAVVRASDFPTIPALASYLASFNKTGPEALASFTAWQHNQAGVQSKFLDFAQASVDSAAERLCAFARREHSVERIRADGSGSLAALLRRHADPNTRDIIAFFTNLGFADFTLNVKAQLEQLGITNYIVFALDPCGADMLARHGLGDRIYYNETDAEGLSAGAEDYMAPRYKTLVDLKVLYAEQIVGLGYNVLVSDVDTLWFANPFDHIPRDADIAAAVDLYRAMELDQTPVTCDEDRPYRVSECKPQDVSTGFYYVRATAASREVLEQMYKRLLGSDHIEQVVFNELLNIVPNGFDRMFRIRYLPRSKFPAGKYFFDDRDTIERFRSGQWQAVVAHANFRIGHDNKLDDCQPHMALGPAQMDKLRLERRGYEGLCA